MIGLSAPVVEVYPERVALVAALRALYAEALKQTSTTVWYVYVFHGAQLALSGPVNARTILFADGPVLLAGGHDPAAGDTTGRFVPDA